MKENANQSRFCSKEGIIKGVILDLIQDLRRLLLLLINDLRGRCQIKFGMTSLFNNGGFTLIELLVVVLIIGILAAVAVPQYQKAVEKARLAEALQNLASIQKAVDIIYLENPNFQGAVVGCKDEEDGKCGVLDVDIESALICDQNNGGACRSKNFAYYARSLNDIMAYRVPNGDYDNEDSVYELRLVRGEDGQWTKYCNWDDSEVYAQSLCDGLETHGWISQEW